MGHSPARPMRPPNRTSPRPMVAVTSSNRTLFPVKVTRPLMASMACGSHMWRSRPPVDHGAAAHLGLLHRAREVGRRPPPVPRRGCPSGTPGGCPGSPRPRRAGPGRPASTSTLPSTRQLRVLAAELAGRPMRMTPCSRVGVDRAVVAQAVVEQRQVQAVHLHPGHDIVEAGQRAADAQRARRHGRGERRQRRARTAARTGRSTCR